MVLSIERSKRVGVLSLVGRVETPGTVQGDPDFGGTLGVGDVYLRRIIPIVQENRVYATLLVESKRLPVSCPTKTGGDLTGKRSGP